MHLDLSGHLVGTQVLRLITNETQSDAIRRQSLDAELPVEVGQCGILIRNANADAGEWFPRVGIQHFGTVSTFLRSQEGSENSE
jgi:hypothetical protein